LDDIGVGGDGIGIDGEAFKGGVFFAFFSRCRQSFG
jgi:hypothetical protein